jgi:NO-binding membrane sensor protein with MHYT domain
LFRILDCLTTQHDWRLVAIAGVVCFLASLTAITLFHRARSTKGRARTVWLAAAGAATGCGIWATHFLAMLAYQPGVPVAYDINLTIVSLLAAGVITSLGLAVAVFKPRRWGAPIGGGIIGGGVAAMHYLGMEALQLPGHVHWDLALVAASIVVGMVLGTASLVVAVRWQSVRAVWASALLLALAILSHHFTAMGAVEVVPDPTRTITELSLSPGLLAIAVASVTVAILGVSLISALADRRVDDKGRLLGIALDNMDQGVVMFDDAGRLVICNDRYTAMYGLPPRLVKPGAMLADIVRYRAETGSLQADPARIALMSWKPWPPAGRSAWSPKRRMGAPYRSSTARYPAANTGSAPTTTSPSAGRRSGKAPSLASSRRAAPPSMRPSPGSARASKAFCRP